MEWQDYEQLVRSIYQHLGEKRGVTIECSGASCKVIGRSGVAHQIDVLTTFNDGLHTYRTAIECKYWKEKIDKKIVMEVASILNDAGLAKAVIVTTVGYTKDAISFAKSLHVELVTLRAPTEEDWRGRLRTISMDISLQIPALKSATFDRSIASEETLSAEPRDCTLIYPDGRREPVMNVLEAFLLGMRFDPTKDLHTERMALPVQTFLTDGIKVIPVSTLHMVGVFEGTSQRMTIRGEDHVAYVLQTEFGNGRYVVDKEGRASERR